MLNGMQLAIINAKIRNISLEIQVIFVINANL